MGQNHHTADKMEDFDKPSSSHDLNKFGMYINQSVHSLTYQPFAKLKSPTCSIKHTGHCVWTLFGNKQREHAFKKHLEFFNPVHIYTHNVIILMLMY